MIATRTFRVLTVGLAVVAQLWSGAGLAQERGVEAVRSDAPAGLRNAYARGWLLGDRNGDDVIDFVNARILVPSQASAAELVVAANVGARLGYETSGADLGLLARADGRPVWSEPLIAIGAAGVALRDVAAGSAPLGPGEGAVSVIRRSSAATEGGVWLDGGDATGLLAVGAYFAGRYPSIWGVRGTPWDSVPAKVARYLEQRGVGDVVVELDRIVIESARPGVSRAEVRVQATSADVAARAIASLRTDTAASSDPNETAPDSVRGSRLRRSELQFTDLHRLDVRVAGGAQDEVIRVLPARPWDTREANAFNAPATPDFSLADAFSVGGFFRDSDQDLVPDRTDAFLSVQGDEGGESLVDLATRIGLETAGVRLPLAVMGGQTERPQESGFPIVFGTAHYQAQRLRERGALHFEEAPGRGFIEFTPRAFDGRHGLVVGGGDGAGLDAAAGFAARRLPYLWEWGKGNARLEDLEREVRRFFQVRETPGQVSFAMHKLREWLDRLDGRDIDSLDVELAVRSAPSGLDAHIRALLTERYPAARSNVRTFTTGFGEGRTIFEQEWDIPWEVDAFREAFLTEALPRLTASSRGRIEVRVSESPEVRDALANEIRTQLRERGIPAEAFDVQVLSAYKQGYSWLHDAILPRIRDARVGAIEIRYHTLEDSEEVRWQQIESPTRWLQELFPVDAVIARELGIADSLITFVPTQAMDPIYTVTVRDRGNREILRETFSPKYVVRPFFDLFPEYEQIRVTTGWVTVEADGATLLDRRIETDPEAFWREFQTKTYARIIDYVMDIQDGRPAPGNAPYFDELRVDLTLSEPNYRIGIDEEVISSVEALHEDIYFETLTLFDLLGGRYNTGLSYPGRILPYMQPPVDGRPGKARITFTGKERGVPRLTLTHRAADDEPVRQEYDLDVLPVAAPKLRGLALDAEADGIAELLFDVAAIDSIGRFEDYRERASEQQIDRTFLPATMLMGMVDELRRLHAAGILRDALSWDRVAATSFRVVPGDTLQNWSRTVTLERSAAPASTARPVLNAAGYRWSGERIVQWQTPIPPVENDSILAKLATFPGVNVYHVGESFLGQNIFAADFLPPYDARYVSQAKLSALRPTLLLSGRQHANEVSSTSHILRLGELLATDSSYARLLRKVNVVLHPITNPDGARLAYEMQQVNPDFMLHAGYLGALGVDATSGAGSEDPIYPESRVRPELQETWLPDIYMNLHGYPSHEWVQLFAGYAAWVRSRTGTQRTWWAPRGWFIPGFSWIDDARYPKIRTAQFAILDSIADAITSDAEIEAMNQRMYARYQKYGKQDVENFREYFHNGILVYSALRGRDATGPGVNNPRITYFSLTTEAPDETARGAWLELVARAGLAHTSALLRYLATGVNEVERQSSEFDAFVTRSAARKKPVVPPAGEARQ